jgi:ABC-type branched-subunit amino acid transport system substrate-binding protein
VDVVAHELEGAYGKQVAWNGLNERGETPHIVLLIGNSGAHGEYWPRLISEIKDASEDSRQLVAAAGLGVSTFTTASSLQQLSALSTPIPMVGAIITADNIHGGPPGAGGIPGFVRVAPTNSDQGVAGVNYGKIFNSPAMLVEDSKRDDLYSMTLATKYNGLAPLVGNPEMYSSMEDSGVRTRMGLIADEICTNKISVVYFAGRAPALKKLLVALDHRQCVPSPNYPAGIPVTVITGDEAAVLSIDLSAKQDTDSRDISDALTPTKGAVTLVYTALAHPEQWSKGAPIGTDTRQLMSFKETIANVFPTEPLDDGHAMMAYDAVSTAVQAIHDLAGQNEPVTSGGIINAWNGLHDVGAVRGVSGTISLDASGNPVDKSIPIVQLDANGNRIFLTLARSSTSNR